MIIKLSERKPEDCRTAWDLVQGNEEWCWIKSDSKSFGFSFFGTWLLDWTDFGDFKIASCSLLGLSLGSVCIQTLNPYLASTLARTFPTLDISNKLGLAQSFLFWSKYFLIGFNGRSFHRFNQSFWKGPIPVTVSFGSCSVVVSVCMRLVWHRIIGPIPDVALSTELLSWANLPQCSSKDFAFTSSR